MSLGPAETIAAQALHRYPFSAAASATLINVSENATFRIDDPATGERAILRVHRPGYRAMEEIASELEWLDALARDDVVVVPRMIPATDGQGVVSVNVDGVPRNAVAFTWLDGDMPDPDTDLIPKFEVLGRTSALLHEHSLRWRQPPGFRRNVWNHETMLGPEGVWGRWQDGLGMGTEELALLSRLDQNLKRRLEHYGDRPDRFGLIHADLRLANLLLEGDDIKVIDFDDSGFSWFIYDFASAVSFMEDHPDVPRLRESWLEGYRTVRALTADDEEEISTMVMLRRLLLVAWIGSHHTEAPEAAALGSGFTVGTCDLAEDYLREHE